MATTLPRVFIVESLNLSDEKKDRFEGNHLSKILRLSGSEPEYMYLRTRRELEEVVDLFKDSEYRYLHISCHGNKSGIGLTFDNLTFEELGELFAPVLNKKRVFFSSCSVMNERCAAALLNKTGCLSVIGPSTSIYFDRATIFWSSFYHLMLRDEASSMKREQLQKTTIALKNLFDVHMRYFTTSQSSVNGYKKVEL